MNSAQNEQIVQSFFARGSEGRIDKCLELLADDVTGKDTGTTRFYGVYRGKQSVAEDVIAEADRFVVVSRGRVETHAGVPCDKRHCQILRLRDGKIASALSDWVFGGRE